MNWNELKLSFLENKVNNITKNKINKNYIILWFNNNKQQ